MTAQKKLKDLDLGTIQKIVQNSNWKLMKTHSGSFFMYNSMTKEIVNMGDFFPENSQNVSKYQLFDDEIVEISKYINSDIMENWGKFKECFISLVEVTTKDDYLKQYRLKIVPSAITNTMAVNYCRFGNHFALSLPFDDYSKIFRILRDAGVKISDSKNLSEKDFYCLDDLFEKSF